MTHLTYKDFFVWAATHHKKLKHKSGDEPDKSAFATIIENAPNPFQTKTDLDDFFSQKRSELKFPFLLLITYDATYDIVPDSYAKKVMDGAFIVMDLPAEKRDYTMINNILDDTEIIGEQILSALYGYVQDNHCTIVKGDGAGAEKIGPIAGDFYGTKFYIKIEAQANSIINDNRNDNTIWD